MNKQRQYKNPDAVAFGLARKVIMAKQITVTVSKKPKELLSILKSRLKKSGGITFSGDEESGTVLGKGYAGRYRLKKVPSGTEVTITITGKPFLVPWGMIASRIKEEAINW